MMLSADLFMEITHREPILILSVIALVGAGFGWLVSKIGVNKDNERI